MKKIILGISSSISAYKSCDLIRLFEDSYDMLPPGNDGIRYREFPNLKFRGDREDGDIADNLEMAGDIRQKIIRNYSSQLVP